MLRRNVILALAAGLIAVVCVTELTMASADDTRVANAAMKDDKESVRALVKEAVDVNTPQGDGLTALHWAALNNDAEMAEMLLYAGANVRATTRIGGYTPLFMAAKSGASPVIEVLLKAGADPKTKGTDGLTPLMMAAMAGSRESARLLLEHGADVDAKESEHGQTPLIFAAAFDRPAVIEELVKHGADPELATAVQQVPQRGGGGGGQGQGQAAAAATAAAGNGQQPQRGARGARGAQPAAGTPAPTAGRGAAAAVPASTATATSVQPQAVPVAGVQPAQPVNGNRGGTPNPRGGLTPLMYAARDGHLNAVQTLVNSGARLNTVSADKSTALLVATINGHFDTAKYLVERGADVNLASMDNATPLYGLVNIQWSMESERPQPSTKREQTNYLDLMDLMLDRGADPNAKLGKVLWYTSFGQAYESTSVIGVTPFWRCAEVGDLDGMKLLLARGADPYVVNKDGVTPLLIASGAGTHGNDDIMAPAGRMAAVKFLVEDLHMDVNAAENAAPPRGDDLGLVVGQGGAEPQASQQGQVGGGNTALHNAAARGDNEMILYLVAHGARVDAVTKFGVTIADMANGPRQRIQPYASTIALLEMLGASNSHKCVSC